jgi:energy-coupling factor transporter ATP-binding protein EcfA2
LPPELADRFGDRDLADPEIAAEIAGLRRRRAAAASAEAEALDAAAAAASGDRARALVAAAARSRALATLAAAEVSWLSRTHDARVARTTGDEERALALRKEESEREERAANEARQQARQEQLAASNPAQLALSAAREKLEAVRAAQAKFEQKLLRRRAHLAALAADHLEFLGRLNLPSTIGAAIAGKARIDRVDDPLFQNLSAELAGARVSALASILASLRDPPEPPSPEALDPAILGFRELYPEPVDALLAQHRALETRAAALATETAETARHELEHHVAETKELTAALVSLLASSSQLGSELRSLRSETGTEVRGEAIQVFVLLADWTRRRLSQLSNAGDYLTDWSHLAALAWILVKLALLLVLLRWALARWNHWMQTAVEAIGATLSYGQAAVLLVRLTESAKHFGPALLVLAFTVASYVLLARSASEVEIVLALAIAIAAIRVQLRIVESACDRLATRAAERERERQLLALEHAAEDSELSGAATDLPPPPDPQSSGWKLFAITWRRLTRYASIFTILLVLTDHTIGRGVFWGLVIRWGWLGAIPLTLFFLRTWRQRIVDELDKRAPGQKGAGPLSRLAANHSHRFYGVFIVFAAFLVVLGRRFAGFVRDHLSNLDSTRRLLAFLFRRRVQKHAREHGRVLEKPHELPEAILEQFPSGPVPPELRPLRFGHLAPIAETYDQWKSEGSNGSIAVVGATGMGKSTLLGMLPALLSTEVKTVTLTDKITRPEELIEWMASTFTGDSGVSSEPELIAALRASERRVLAIDDCHNLFLREVGGFDAWDAFTRVVNETSDQIFWVLTLSEAAWAYLDNVGGGVSYFRKVVRMPAWTETELRRLILTRMRRARYRVNFSDLLVTRLENVKVSSQIIRTSQGYFRLLWDYADGNPGLACFFWLRSLVPDTEGKSVRVHLFAAPRIDELQALSDDIAFVLTAIVEHQNATPSELAVITNLPEALCRFAVQYGCERGYLDRLPTPGGPGGERVSLSPLWQQTVFTYLKRKHLLYS